MSVLLLMLAASLAAPELTEGPRYFQGAFKRPIYSELEGRPLEKNLRELLSTRQVASLVVTAPGGAQIAYPPLKGLRTLNPAVGRAIRLMLWNQQPGLEMDLLITPAPSEETAAMKLPRVPVTLIWEGETLAVEHGPVFDARYPALSVSEFLSRWDVTLEIENNDWTEPELGLLDQALSLLTPAEQAIVTQIPFRRVAKPPPPDGRHDSESPVAVFAFDLDNGARFEFYRPRIDRDRTVFRGEPSAPLLMPVAVLVHEFGHAIASGPIMAEISPYLDDISTSFLAYRKLTALADSGAAPDEIAPWRTRYDERMAALAAQGCSEDQLDAYLNRIREPDPAELALDALVGDRQRVSEYAYSDAAEHFAEMFELYRTDPAAVERLYPDVADWFDQGGHLARPD